MSSLNKDSYCLLYEQSMYLGHASGVYNTQGSVMITLIQIFNNL